MNLIRRVWKMRMVEGGNSAKANVKRRDERNNRMN